MRKKRAPAKAGKAGKLKFYSNARNDKNNQSLFDLQIYINYEAEKDSEMFGMISRNEPQASLDSSSCISKAN